jgi:hypothetical protein
MRQMGGQEREMYGNVDKLRWDFEGLGAQLPAESGHAALSQK